MRFIQLALLLSPVLAFTIPEGQADGIYGVSYVDGQEVHTLITPNNETPPQQTPAPSGLISSAKFLAKRNDITCGGDALNHADTDRANNELDKQCGNGNGVVGIGMDFYSIAGCTVAYFCNFDTTHSWGCFDWARQEASRQITAQCGWYKSGWSTDPNSWSYGYENICKAPGNNFCGRGTHG